MTRPANILIVDDDPSVLESLQLLVEDEGDYRVLTATSATEAMDLVERNCIHCIALDVILTTAQNDKTGFDLAKKLGKTTPKFFLTCLDDGDSTQEGLEISDANVVKYLFKRQGEQAILKTIKDIVKGLNLELTIHWGTWTSLMLVEMFKHFKGKSVSEKRVIAEELESLLCSAFKSATEVTLLDINRGKGGCVVAKVRPRLPEGTGAPVMVKFGPRATIMQEYDNYTDWVRPYLQHETTQVLEEPAQTFHLAAIKYSFVGGSNPKGSFKEFFAVSTAQDIKELIGHLIGNTCEKWYEARRPPKPEERLPLDEIYRKRESLNLADSKHVIELEKTIAQLLSSNTYAGILKADGPAQIEVRLNSVSEWLPNPMVYAFRERWHNGYETEIFPSPSLLAITHGDLNGENIVVNAHGRGFLIDFYKTGFSPVCRDFVELESIIKFELLQLSNLQQRYQLESDLLSPAKLSDPIPVAPQFAHDAHVLKVISVIEHLRRLATLASNSDDPTEYYVGLMFNALKEILGFSSGHDEPTCCEMRQFHALLSAAKICQKLMLAQTKPTGPGSPPLIFLSHAREDVNEVNKIYKRLSAEGFKPWMAPGDIPLGMPWKRAVDVALEEAHTVIVVLSKWAVQNRGYNQSEIKKALELSMNMLPDDRYLIPVVIERLEPEFTIPRELQELQVAQIYEPDGWDRLVQSLRESVARRNR